MRTEPRPGETNHCACHLDEDGETILRWCLVHAKMRDDLAETRKAEELLASIGQRFSKDISLLGEFLALAAELAEEAEHNEQGL